MAKKDSKRQEKDKKAESQKQPVRKAGKAAGKEKKTAGAKIRKGLAKKIAKKVKKEKPEETDAKKEEKEGKKQEKIVVRKKPVSLHYYETILHPLITEKAVNMIEAENTLCFIVSRSAGKQDIKDSIEALYNVKVDKVRVLNDRKGRKKAIVKINKAFKADDIATRLGVI